MNQLPLEVRGFLFMLTVSLTLGIGLATVAWCAHEINDMQREPCTCEDTK